MAKKIKNPFDGNPESSDPDFEKFSKMRLKMQKMEKILGKERFEQILNKAIYKLEKGLNDDDDLDDAGEFKDSKIKFDIITTKEWSQTHPANLVCASDKYYADLANDIADILSGYPISIGDPGNFIRELGRVLAAYLEDLVSETKIFSAMRRVCKERYGYLLPFYDCNHSDYMPDHLNVEDIRFLIWMVACHHGKKYSKTFSPLAPGWEVFADRIFDELNDRYEEAPEATRVADWMRKSFRRQDYIDIREIATWLVFYNPLTCRPGYIDEIWDEAEKTVEDHDIDYEIAEKLVYSVVANESWQCSMSAMGCPSKTLIAAVAAEFGYESLAEEIENIEVLPTQIYAVSQDKKTRDIFFEQSNHERLKIERESLSKGSRLNGMRYTSGIILKFKEKYMLNGALAGSPESPEIKEKWENQPTCMTPEEQNAITQEWIDLLGGQQAVCVSNIKSILKKLGMLSYPGLQDMKAGNYVVLVSREMGLAVLPDSGYAFAIPDNRFFRKRKAAKESFAELVFQNSLPHDVAMYIQDNNLLSEACIGASQGKAVGRQIVQDYLAFWIGFYRELPAYGDALNFERPDAAEEITDTPSLFD